jgi:V/A-type H+-transporting ATPase subunit D
MAKIKLTKGELKRQRDELKQFLRYLPTLQLKKQQLQLEILQQNMAMEEKKQFLAKRRQSLEQWIALLAEGNTGLKKFLSPSRVSVQHKNIAGVDIPVFDAMEFIPAEYDLFLAPLWLDGAIDALKEIVMLNKDIALRREGIEILRRELRVTTQRVNLFEKVKIPQAEENIRLIKIYIGDQMANAVGRCKIAKKKIEEMVLAGAMS